jgi:hypothetical protein
MTRVIELTVWLALLASAPALAQGRPQTPPPPPPGVTPQPLGRGGDTTPAPSGTTATQAPRPQAPASQAATPPRTTPPATPGGTSARPTTPPNPSILPSEPAPTEAQLGLPIFPGAKFLRSFDAGQGQRYYLFGSTASFAELVLYYRTQLKDRGDLVYDVPPVHMFEVGRFREESMAFPPGVTVKDYTWGGAKGYLVPTPGATMTRYPTVIQFVPVTAANK